MTTFALDRFGQMTQPTFGSVGGVPYTLGGGRGSVGGVEYDIPNVITPAPVGSPSVGGSSAALPLGGLAGMGAGILTNKGLHWYFDQPNVPVPTPKPGTGDLTWGTAGAEPGMSYNPYPEDPGMFTGASDAAPVAGAEGGSWLPQGWSDLGSGALKFGLDAAGSYLASQAGWGGSSTGRQIGGGIGSAIGSYVIPIPFVGSMFGSAIGQMIGSNFGPDPTVGPNGAINFGVENGMLVPTSWGGDNGLNLDSAASRVRDGAMLFNSLVSGAGGQITMPSGGAPFGVSWGPDAADPSWWAGKYGGPLLDENSFYKALLQNGFVTGLSDEARNAIMAQLGGADPEHAWWGSHWYRPETLAPTVQAALQKPGADGNLSGFWEVGDLPAWMTGYQASGAGSDTYTVSQPGQRPASMPVGNPWYSGPTQAPEFNIPDWYGGNTA